MPGPRVGVCSQCGEDDKELVEGARIDVCERCWDDESPSEDSDNEQETRDGGDWGREGYIKYYNQKYRGN